MSKRGRLRRPWPGIPATATAIAISTLKLVSQCNLKGQFSDAFVFPAPSVGNMCSQSKGFTTAACSVQTRMVQRAGVLGRTAQSVCDRRRHRRKAERPLFASLDGSDGGAAPVGVAPGVSMEGGEDMGMAPVDMEQAMGSFSPQWENGTQRADPKEQLIKGSVIQANQTAFPYATDRFPPRINSEVYYNGTSEQFWWNQDADSVCVYVPVAESFDVSTVEFVAKTKHVSLKLGGEEILSGTPFYRIDGYESLYVVDMGNDPPYVQLELYKFREYQNWEDFLIEGSSWTPGGVG